MSNHQPADLVLGQPSFTANTANNGGQGLSTLNGPRYCHTDGTRLWVSDSGNARVLQWNAMPTANAAPANIVIGQASPSSSTPGASQTAITDRTGKPQTHGGRLYVADMPHTRVMVWDPAPVGAHGAAASNVIGQTSFVLSSRGLAQNRWDQPFALTFAQSRLILADTFNHRVLVYDQIPASGQPSANVVLGQLDAMGNPSFTQRLNPTPPTASSMNDPFDVHYDAGTDRLFVADTINHRVLGWQGVPSTTRPADFVLGQIDFMSNAQNAGQPSANAIGMHTPRAVFTLAGSLFVSDSGNNRVMVWTPIPGGSTQGAPARGVLGRPDLVTRGPATSQQDLRSPWGVCGAGNRLFVVDGSDHRVLGFTLTP